jgi:hypothetical protein
VLFELLAPANEVPEVKLSGSAKRQRALAQLPTFPFIAACGTKTPLFAAFAVLKTRTLYVMLCGK